MGYKPSNPASLMSLDSRHIGTFDVPFSTLLERAVLNLREKSVVLFVRDPGGFHLSQYNDLYDCSRLLVPHLFDLLSLNGDPIAVPLARNGLVVAGSKDVGALLAMAQFVEQQIETATRPIGYMPIILRDGEWRTFDLPEPELGPLRELVAKQRLWDYEIQREMIEAHFQKSQRDVYVGKLDAIKFEGRIISYTTWARNVLTLLPKADVVAIPPERGGLALLRKWDDFFAVCGECLTDEGFYPTRYLTPPTMSEERLRRLEREFSIPEWWPPERDGVRHFK
ncbi:MAG: hypothetical protein KBA31_06500 [Alphaproteobacteria bacterium]|nr:hypothetical protein [Alphaproteobacteria bacterium]